MIVYDCVHQAINLGVPIKQMYCSKSVDIFCSIVVHILPTDGRPVSPKYGASNFYLLHDRRCRDRKKNCNKNV